MSRIKLHNKSSEITNVSLYQRLGEVRRVSDVHIFQPRPTKRKDEDDSSDRQLYHIHIQLVVTCIRPSKIRASMPICVRAADVDQVVLTRTFVTLVLRRR